LFLNLILSNSDLIFQNLQHFFKELTF
jgi:hypothetical protein